MITLHFKVSSDNIRILDEFSDLFSHEINMSFWWNYIARSLKKLLRSDLTKNGVLKTQPSWGFLTEVLNQS